MVTASCEKKNKVPDVAEGASSFGIEVYENLVPCDIDGEIHGDVYENIDGDEALEEANSTSNASPSEIETKSGTVCLSDGTVEDQETSNESKTGEVEMEPIEVDDSTEEQSDVEYPDSKEVSDTTAGVEDTAKTFYRQHYKGIKKLLPSQLPGSYKTFQGFLQEIFPNSKSASSGPIEDAGENSSHAVSRMRAFLAVAFPPVIVGSLATGYVWCAEQGKRFPQFSYVSGSTIKCEICIPYQKWAIENHEKHHKLKAKQVTIQSILEGTGILSFSGIVQAKEHSFSKYHQDALQFFTKQKPPLKMRNPSTEKMRNRVPKDIMAYFTAPLN